MYLVGYHFLPYSFALWVCTMFPCGWSWGGAEMMDLLFHRISTLHISFPPACITAWDRHTIPTVKIRQRPWDVWPFVIAAVATQAPSGTHALVAASHFWSLGLLRHSFSPHWTVLISSTYHMQSQGPCSSAHRAFSPSLCSWSNYFFILFKGLVSAAAMDSLELSETEDENQSHELTGYQLERCIEVKYCCKASHNLC